MVWAGAIPGTAGVDGGALLAGMPSRGRQVAGGVVGAIAGTVVTKKIINDPGALPWFENIAQ